MTVSSEVRRALQEKRPVVALESSIIAQGMPYPENVRTALRVEKTIRKFGVVPATTGIIDGEPIVGMSPEQIREFGKRKGIRKVSRRDFPVVMARREWGATTVAGTMILAAKAGIEVMVTGGIGGAHRGAEKTFDVSADLEELEKTNVTVVSSGAKAILDLGLTLEILETKGVPVLSYRSREFADFYGRHSGIMMDNVVRSPLEVAKVIKAKRDAGLAGGILVANPIPRRHALESAGLEQEIEEAIREAESRGIKGKKLTPFLLGKIAGLSGGKSLEANVELVLSNARLGAKIARELSAL